MKYLRMHAVLAIGTLALTACDLGPNAQGEARVYLSAAPSASVNTGGDAITTQSGPIALSMIDSLFVHVYLVDVNNGDSESGWQTLELVGDPQQRLDLLDLPVDGTGSLELAAGMLDVGSYNHIRLRFDETLIKMYLNQDVTLGDGTVLAAGGHLVRVPSGTETGLKIHTARFEVTEDETAAVQLVFDGPTSIGNVHTTGNGTVMMSPVLRSRD